MLGYEKKDESKKRFTVLSKHSLFSLPLKVQITHGRLKSTNEDGSASKIKDFL